MERDRLFLTFMFLCICSGALAATWHVDDDAPADFSTIQAALDAASDNDTVIVRDGMYTGDGNRDIDFGGKAVHLRSQNGPTKCIVNAEGTDKDPHRGFIFQSGEGKDSIVEGFTIKNGYAAKGGGIACENSSSPTIRHNIITGNTATAGGGIYLSGGAATVTNNTIVGNTATNESGGGICCRQSSPTISSSILWANTAPEGAQLSLLVEATLSVSYSDVEGGQGNVLVGSECNLDWGKRNINADPLFADPDNGDYHLKAEHGRWDPAARRWVNDDVTSRCIDAGDPVAAYSAEPMPNFGRINMGAYGNTAEASKTWWTIGGDATGDCKVNIDDMIFIRDRIGKDMAEGDNWKADVNRDGSITILDMIAFRCNLNAMCE